MAVVVVVAVETAEVGLSTGRVGMLVPLYTIDHQSTCNHPLMRKKAYVVNHLGVNIEFRLVDNKWRKGGLRNTKQHVNNGPNVERHIYSVRKVIVT